MSENLTKDEFVAHITPLRESVATLVQLQRDQNGRVGRAETRIAVLEDRSPGRVSASVSAVISGVITGLGLWFSSKQ
jgi:hypothetical protein